MKQAFFAAEPEDVEVSFHSPTSNPMRMSKASPAIGNALPLQCDAYGYGLDQTGACSYRAEYDEQPQTDHPRAGLGKICLCAMMYGYKVWTCGQTVSRSKEITHRLPDGTYQLLTTEQVFQYYASSTDQRIQLPPSTVPA